jgi:hypothetical protein
MQKRLLYFLILIIIPLTSLAQNKKNKSTEQEYQLVPFKQEEKEIYHYAVLTELPFENGCDMSLSEKERIACSEKNLRRLIYSKLDYSASFRGNVYAYITISKEAQISTINIKSYPKSEEISSSIEDAIRKVNFNQAKHQDETVTARLWTSFTFPSSSKEIFSESLERMKADTKAQYDNYEELIFDATEYIFSNPVYPNSKEFNAATQIVGYWMNKDTPFGIPTFGNFYTTLTNKNKQQFLYVIAMINYELNQKLKHNRVLTCKPIEGIKYSEQKDVKEVQLEGAKILLDFIGDKENNVEMNSKTKKYYKAYKDGKLGEKLFEK